MGRREVGARTLKVLDPRAALLGCTALIGILSLINMGDVYGCATSASSKECSATVDQLRLRLSSASVKVYTQTTVRGYPAHSIGHFDPISSPQAPVLKVRPASSTNASTQKIISIETCRCRQQSTWADSLLPLQHNVREIVQHACSAIFGSSRRKLRCASLSPRASNHNNNFPSLDYTDGEGKRHNLYRFLI
jgi:hypothetical protein